MADKEVGGVVIRLDIPPSSHPGTIQGDTPGATLGRSALETVYTAYGKINDLAGQVRSKELLAVSAQPFAERMIASASKTLNVLAAHPTASRPLCNLSPEPLASNYEPS